MSGRDKILELLSPVHPGGPNVNLAVGQLPVAASYYNDARLCDSLMNAIYGIYLSQNNTAGLAAIGTDREAKRVALAHVLFKIAGVVLFIFWIPGFADIIRAMAERFGSGPARQIANAHTIFNVALGVFFLPFIGLFARLIKTILPDRPEEKKIVMATRYLDEDRVSTPALALDLARAEIARMSQLIQRMLRAIIIPFMSDERFIKQSGLSHDEKEMLISEIPKQDAYIPHLTLLQGIDMREEKIEGVELTRHAWHKLVVEVRGNSIKIWVDGVFAYEHVDNKHPFLQGTVGFKTFEAEPVRFDNMVVTSLD